MRTGRGQALAWRLERQFLSQGAGSCEQVVARLGAVPAASGDADLSIRRRLSDGAPGEVARALDSGRLLKTYAFRGATHLMTPAQAGRYLALRAAGRMWELPSWVEHYALEPRRWPALRDVVRGAVADGPVTRDELAAAVTGHPGFGHLGPAFAAKSDTFLKPFAWQGDICFGPVRDGRATFQSPETSPGWDGIPDLDEAGPAAVSAYFDAYGPANPEHLHYWLGNGLGAGRKRITRWLAELADELVDITVDGEPMLHAAKHADALAAQPATTAVTLLPGYDQWVLGPGTADHRVVPAPHRAVVSRGANLVLVAGIVAGSWKIAADTVTVTWFAETGGPSRSDVDAEVERLAALLGRRLDSDITVD